MLTGRCNCGAVSFEVSGDIRSISACHCGQCRRQSGGVWHSAVAPAADVTITGAPQWYRSSAAAQRGFCPTCGAFLFWKHDDEPGISFALGALEPPTRLALEKHIFTADKGDYYEITDNLPQEDQ